MLMYAAIVDGNNVTQDCPYSTRRKKPPIENVEINPRRDLLSERISTLDTLVSKDIWLSPTGFLGSGSQERSYRSQPYIIDIIARNRVLQSWYQKLQHARLTLPLCLSNGVLKPRVNTAL